MLQLWSPLSLFTSFQLQFYSSTHEIFSRREAISVLLIAEARRGICTWHAPSFPSGFGLDNECVDMDVNSNRRKWLFEYEHLQNVY